MMKFKKSISILVLCIVILSLVSCLTGLFSKGGTGEYEYQTITNEMVKIYGSGIYKNDSVDVVAQGKASDLITLVMGIPLLLISLCFTRKGSFRGKLILTGTLGYFLYTFMSYAFLWMYNSFFIVYVALMSLSLFAFILSMMSFDVGTITSNFKDKLPVKLLGGYQIFLAFAVGMLWLGKIAPSIFNGAVPVGLGHYTTLVIQGMDLGIIIPGTILSGILLIKRNPYGYLLSSVLIIKFITMITCICAMMINQALNNVEVGIAPIAIFSTIDLFTIICLFILLKNTIRKSEVR